MPVPPSIRPRFAGVSVAVVTNNRDPDARGRVRLRFPWLPEDHESAWVRVAVPHAGEGRGCYVLPEVDDEVLVAFEEADPDRPVVIGSLWAGRDPLPCEPAEGNARKCLRLRSGFQVVVEEEAGGESLAIIDPDEKRSIGIDIGRGEIRVTADEGDVRIAAPDGTVHIECRDLRLEAAGRATLEGRSVDVRADAAANLRGNKVAIRGDALLTQEAPLVKIN